MDNELKTYLQAMESRLIEKQTELENRRIERQTELENRLFEKQTELENRLVSKQTELENRLVEKQTELKNHLIEEMRGMQTELLRGFEAFSAGQTIRLRKVEADQSNLDVALRGRVDVVETRLTQIELRLGIQGPEKNRENGR